MSAATHSHGFRIVGPCTGDRRRVHAPTAFTGYCHCDAKARVEREAYLSAFQFDDGFAEHLARTGSPAGFTGSTWSPFVWLDIDRNEAAGGVARALADTKRLVDTLDERFGVPRGVLVPFVSGGKGMHLGIPTALWAPPASGTVRHLRSRFSRGLVVQGAGRLPIVQRQAHGADRGTLGRSRHSTGPHAAVGDLRAEASAVVSWVSARSCLRTHEHLHERSRAVCV